MVVDVLSVKLYPRELLLKCVQPAVDIVCTHPMFGPVSGAGSWHDLPFMFDSIRVTPSRQHIHDAFVDIFRREKCRMVQMTCEQHETDAASSQFLTDTTGTIMRVIDRMKMDFYGFVFQAHLTISLFFFFSLSLSAFFKT